MATTFAIQCKEMIKVDYNIIFIAIVMSFLGVIILKQVSFVLSQEVSCYIWMRGGTVIFLWCGLFACLHI